jgi:hypothetical protein
MDLIDEVLDRLLELPAENQDSALRCASEVLDNWKEMSDKLISRAIEREFYEICAILRDI